MYLHPTPLPAPFIPPVPRPAAPLGDLVDAILPAPGVEPLRAALADPDVLVVTTGQQAGLFTGPLYTIHKALSAAALAAQLEARWGRPVRPLFWVAGDDHDYVEIAAAGWVDDTGRLGEVRLPPRPADAPLHPMYREPLDAGIEGLLEQFAEALPDAPHRAATLAWLGRHYRPGATVAGAYGLALAELLAPLGIACLDSTHVSVKRAAAPLMLRALREAERLEQLLVAESASFTARGEASPVVVGDGATLVFLEDRLGRDRLVRSEGGFRTRRGGEVRSWSQLEAIARDDPQRFSPNVLLRPVLESAILPTVAYIGGPGELRYLSLTPPVFAALGVARQIPVPRWSGVIIESPVARIIAKFGSTVEEVLRGGNALATRIVQEQVPPEVLEALARLETDSAELLDRATPAVLALDPTLERPIASARRQMVWASRDLSRRIHARVRARATVELAQVARVLGALLPGGHPQERVLTVAPFLARHGPRLLEAIRDAAVSEYASALEARAPRP